jgi:hypothetical protein
MPGGATEKWSLYKVSEINAFRLVWINLQGIGVNWIQSLSKRLKVDSVLELILGQNHHDLYPISNLSLLSVSDPFAPGFMECGLCTKEKMRM